METTNIYTLTDPRTNKVRYVGKANNVSQRYKAHLNKARKHQTHKWNWIQQLKREGLKPIIDVIDIVSIYEWQYWEIYWISQMKQWGFDLVNYTNGGDGCTFSNQTSFKKGDGGKRVVGYNKEGVKVYEFKTTEEATKIFKIHKSNIPCCCSVGCRSKTVKGYAWFYLDDVVLLNNNEIRKLVNERYNKNLKSNGGSFKIGQKGIRSKKVKVIDLDSGDEIIYESGLDAANKIGVSQPSISWAIKNSKIIKKQYKIMLL